MNRTLGVATGTAFKTVLHPVRYFPELVTEIGLRVDARMQKARYN